MSFIAAIDISTFIWCEHDYNANKNRYYKLIEIAPTIFDKIKELKLSILLRKELCESIMEAFPYNMINEISYEFQNITLLFLTNTEWYPYTDDSEKVVTSKPQLLKKYFRDSILAETQSQVCHLFYDGKDPEHKFIAYSYFFNQHSNLVLNNQNDKVEVDTLRYNSKEEIIQFFEKYRLKFKHNEKHRNYCYYDYERSEIVSPFSSYHNHGEAEAQKLLDEAFPFDGHFYNFDLKNDVYVRFIKTMGLTYHGHDISDEGENVPKKIKKKFNKNGRTFYA